MKIIKKILKIIIICIGAYIILISISIPITKIFFDVNKDLSDYSMYKDMLGKRYKTNMDFVVWGTKKNYLLTEIGVNPMPPADKMPTEFPAKYYKRKIWGILPAGSNFEIVEVQQKGSKEMNFTIYRIMIINSVDSQWIGKVMEPIGMGLSNYFYDDNPVPRFDIKYAEQIKDGSFIQ